MLISNGNNNPVWIAGIPDNLPISKPIQFYWWLSKTKGNQPIYRAITTAWLPIRV